MRCTSLNHFSNEGNGLAGVARRRRRRVSHSTKAFHQVPGARIVSKLGDRLDLNRVAVQSQLTPQNQEVRRAKLAHVVGTKGDLVVV